MESKKVKFIINRVLIALFLGLVVIQLFHPAANSAGAATADDITKMYTVPDSVQTILKKACFDCHSDCTVYPWYNRIQPVAWWLDDHIREGKSHVNFSEFGKYPFYRQAKKLKKCAHEIEEGGMPMDQYLWIHKDAILTAQEKQTIISWLNKQSEAITAAHPESVDPKAGERR
jgi:Haem-binding domain